MLSYKSNQNVQPLCDYYVETDLDSFDDQPVDYSKKYSDQESYEDCRRGKSVSKTDEFSGVSQTVKQNCNDEVKVYCVEGTPLTISSASSFCDLREISAGDVAENSGIKDTLSPLPNDESLNSFDVDLNKNPELLDCKQEESSLCKEKEDVKEVKSVSFRSVEDISKASSPLMFSRSSSVASLNSYEQQSIIDDRSSVSVYSVLTSGLISPSDLPDSPGEMMSPPVTDKSNSPKIDVTEPDSDNESDNLILCEKDKIDPEKNVENNCNDATSDQIQCPEVEETVKDSSPVKADDDSDEDDALLQRCVQMGMSGNTPNKSIPGSATLSQTRYSPHSTNFQSGKDFYSQAAGKSDEDSDGDDILLQQCIQLGMSNESPKIETGSQVYKRMDCPTVPMKTNDYQEIVKDNSPVKLDDDSDEDDALLQRCIQMGMAGSTPNKSISGFTTFSQARYSPHPTNFQSGQNFYSQAAGKSDEDSDGDDILLQKCIQLGMPNKSSEIETGSQVYKRMDCPTAPIKTNDYQEIVKDSSPVKLDEDSDEDDALLQRCIQMGMPANTPNKTVVSSATFSQARYSPQPANFQSGKDFYSQAAGKSDEDSDGDDILLQKCIQLGMPSKSSEIETSSQVYKRMVCPTVPMKTNDYQVQKNIYPPKLEDLGKDEKNTLLQHCIQRGMPRESFEKKMLQPSMCEKSDYDSPVNYCTQNDLRDDCPDGISDGDEEDALLEKCIRAGMPSPKITMNVQNRLHNNIPVTTSRKLTLPNHHFLPDSSTEADKKFTQSRLPQNQPYAPVHSSTTWISSTSFIDVDSMRIYRTEDTPILSPTASISDLSSLSFNESFLNNSRNSDYTSDSDDDDDELLLRCIRSGMPEAKRAVA